MPEEPNRQVYLSSIRGADEWSYQYFLDYVNYMEESNKNYFTVALPYQLGVKNKYISRSIVEQSFRDNPESRDVIAAETKLGFCKVICIYNPFNCAKPLKSY